MKTYEAKNLKFLVENETYDISFTAMPSPADGVTDIAISITFPENSIPETIEIKYFINAPKAYSQWSPTASEKRSFRANWSKATSPSRTCCGAPIQVVYGADGNNVFTQAVSDIKTPLELQCGMLEETAQLECQLNLFTMPVGHLSSYQTILRIDQRPLPIPACIGDVRTWWFAQNKLPQAYIPDTAKLPMYSSWYSFHQQLDVEKILVQCKIAKQLGIETVIVDDGWQTDNSERGYAYCGDWQPCYSRVGNMKDFVDAVHDTGMKFMLWYSVPFVGIHSKAHTKFEGKFLDDGKSSCGFSALDPRYPEVRDYLVTMYQKALKDWNLDGFKLDFIDSFSLSEYSMTVRAGMDYEKLEDAVEALLEEIMTGLRSIKPDVLIEFRQSYIGPLMQTYGNMLRVGDCPNDPVLNRCGILDLRMMSGECAIHSDMLMWNLDNTAQEAARQITNILFGVPQISVMLDEIPEEHQKMIKFYMDFWLSHREVLLSENLTVYHPEAAYTMAHTTKNDRAVCVNYAESMWKPEAGLTHLSYVNAGASDILYLDLEEYKGAVYTIYSCMGEVLEKGTVTGSSVFKFQVPVSGILELECQ